MQLEKCLPLTELLKITSVSFPGSHWNSIMIFYFIFKIKKKKRIDYSIQLNVAVKKRPQWPINSC